MVKKHRQRKSRPNRSKIKAESTVKSPDRGVSGKNGLKYIILALALISVVAVGSMMFIMNQQKQARSDSVNKLLQQTTYQQGGVYQCRRIPAFVAANGLRQPVVVDTKQSTLSGPVFREAKQNGKVFRDASWAQTGHVGPVILDKRGDVYVIPVPAVSLDKNPPALQNRVYKIDGRSAKMQLFLELPSETLPNFKNPFGAMGQAYDCETDSLYVSSISGSTPAVENGKILQINAITGDVISSLDGIDALGVGVFNLQHEKRLYFGRARNSGVYSVALDKSGRIQTAPRYEFALSEINDGSTTKAKKIRFSKNKQGAHLMTVSELDFDYRPVAHNTHFVKRYIYQFDPARSRWEYLQFVWE